MAAESDTSEKQTLRAQATLGRSLPTPTQRVGQAFVAGLGGFLAITGLAYLTELSGAVLLIAPFGASCVLVFALPASPLAQPRNVVGGHLLSTLVGLLAFAVLGASPFAFGLGVGGAIVAMLLTGTTHPPAGADPIVAIVAGASWPFLFAPVLAGTLAIVCLGWTFHRFVSKDRYPA